MTKINSAGSALVYSTYLGGSGFDQSQGIAVDASGNAYVTGWTLSTDFPTKNPLQANFSGRSDVFVTKIDPAGSDVVYSTYLSGNGGDIGFGIAVDGLGNAYVMGNTSSTNFPTVNPLQASFQRGLEFNIDGFVLIISANSSVAVPNVVGMTKAAAVTTITGVRLVVGTVTTATSNSVPAGSVISENPPAGTVVNLVSPVNLVVSGSQPISVGTSGSGWRQLFSFIARDGAGASNIQYTQFLFSKSGLSGLNACFITYDPVVNVFYLLSDDMTQWYGLLGGSANTIGNAQCTIHGALSGSTRAGTDLTTEVDIGFHSGFSGLTTIYQSSGDTLGNVSGWQSVGTWNALGDPNVVELVSLAPNFGSGASQVFTSVTTDGNGAGTIPFVQFVMNNSLSGFNGCFVHYDRASNVFYLLNDAGTAWFGLFAGSATQVSNSQCTLNGIGSVGTPVGPNFTVTYNLTFSASFTGTKQIYMQAVDNTGVIEAWHKMGTWTP